MASEPPPAPSSAADRREYEARQCVLLEHWWLERVQGDEGKIRVAGTASREGAPSSMGNRNVAGRVFRSTAIKSAQDQHTIETEDGRIIKIRRLLNFPRTRDNGFSEEVCKCFEFGFPGQWVKLVNPNTVQTDEQPLSESAVEYWMEKFLSDDLTDLNKYAFEENDSYPAEWYTTSNTDGPAIQSLSNLPDDNAANMAASGGDYGSRMNMPGTPLARPRETSCSGQQSDQHESMKIGTSEQGLDDHSISSVSVNRSTGSFCPNSKGDDSLLATSKIITERMTPQFGAVRGSEDSPVRRLRSGRVFGTPSGGLVKNGHKKRKIQHEASSQNMIPNEGKTLTADLTSRKNDLSVAEVVTKDKLEARDSHREITAMKAKKKRKEARQLFWNWC